MRFNTFYFDHIRRRSLLEDTVYSCATKHAEISYSIDLTLQGALKNSRRYYFTRLIYVLVHRASNAAQISLDPASDNSRDLSLTLLKTVRGMLIVEICQRVRDNMQLNYYRTYSHNRYFTTKIAMVRRSFC